MNVQVIGRAVDCGGKVIGVAGDHRAEKVRFRFDREPNGKAYIKLRPPSGDPFRTELTVDGTEAVWEVDRQAAASAGTLTCQLLTENGDYSPPWVWQSEKFTLTVLESLPYQKADAEEE